MENIISPDLGLTLVIAYGLIMIIITFIANKIEGKTNLGGFLIANQKASWILGSTSIAASWTWSIALMISVQLAYQQGLAGLFWFVVPNIVAILIFIKIAPTMREKMSLGYSLPEWIDNRFNDRIITKLYLFILSYYQIMATAMQIYAGAYLLSVATSINHLVLMPIVLLLVILYTIISGLKASMLTDFIQFTIMLIVSIWISYMVISSEKISLIFTGVNQTGSANPFDFNIMFSLGIIMTISLISASLGDQQLWQRVFAIKKTSLRKSFFIAAILFGLIPISLSLIGFAGASITDSFTLPNNFDMSLIGFVIVKNLLPVYMAIIFLFALLSGLASTLDSALSASSTLSKLMFKNKEFGIYEGRITMLVTGIAGLILSYSVALIDGFDLKYFWWTLNTLTASIAIPTILSIFSNTVTSKGIRLGIILSILVGLPIFVYGSITGNDYILAIAYISIVGISGVLSRYYKG